MLESEVVYELDEYGELIAIDCETGKKVAKVTALDVKKYSPATGRAIADLIIQGNTLSAISRMKGMPSITVISYWRRRYPDFDEAIDRARQHAAETFHDKIIDIADKTETKEEVHVNEFKVRTLKWAAEKGDPARYGNQTKIVGDAGQPLQFIINTGINREEVPEKIENHIEGECNEQKSAITDESEDGNDIADGAEPTKESSADAIDERESGVASSQK